MSRRTITRSGVYQIVNEVNGKSYVGSSQNVEARWDQHRYTFRKPMKYPTKLWYAVNKHGMENFTFIFLEACDPTKEVILSLEQRYIDAIQPEYNILTTAGSRQGIPHSPEVLEKITAINKANGEKYRQGKTFEEIMGEEKAAIAKAKQVDAKADAEIKCHCAGWNKGVTPDEETLQQLLTQGFQQDHEPWNKGTTGLMPEPWNKGVPMPDETRQKVSEGRSGIPAHNKGKPMSEAQRLKMTERTIDPEHQAAMTEAARIANTGRTYSQEHCDAISEGNLNSAARKAYAESRRGIARSDELKQKVSVGIKSSEKFQASVQRRAGRKRVDNTSGHYGIVWDKGREKWMARANKKSKRFATIEEAIQWRDEILAAA